MNDTETGARPPADTSWLTTPEVHVGDTRRRTAHEHEGTGLLGHAQRYAWDAQPRRVRTALVALYILVVIALIAGTIAGWTVAAAFWPGHSAGQ